MLTVYGIETDMPCHHSYHQIQVAIVLTVYGIETFLISFFNSSNEFVATALTVYGMRRRVRDSRGSERR